MKTFSKIVTHVRPHLDEIVAIWFLRKFGEERFPGISTAPVEYWDAGPQTSDGRSAQEHFNEGTILIGVGGSEFDEHANFDEDRKEDQCAASLMAHELGLDHDPCFIPLLEYTTGNDLKGGAGTFEEKRSDGRQRVEAGMFHLAALTMRVHALFPDQPETALQWAMISLEAYYEDQKKFFEDCRAAYTDAQEELILLSEGEALRLVWIRSDLEQMPKFARSRLAPGGPADLFVQQRSSGHIQIYGNQKGVPFNFPEIVKIIRVKEAKKRMRETKVHVPIPESHYVLRAEGTIEFAPEWHWHQKGGALLNGSLTAPNKPPTRLSLETILAYIRVAIQPTRFEIDHAAHCLQGQCTHHLKPCGWHELRLQRCYHAQTNQPLIPIRRLVTKKSSAATV